MIILVLVGLQIVLVLYLYHTALHRNEQRLCTALAPSTTDKGKGGVQMQRRGSHGDIFWVCHGCAQTTVLGDRSTPMVR